MASINFNLKNNQDRDVIVAVSDLQTNALVLDGFSLVRGGSVGVAISADSSGKGAAEWVFWTFNGVITGKKLNNNIREGDTDTLG